MRAKLFLLLVVSVAVSVVVVKRNEIFPGSSLTDVGESRVNTESSNEVVRKADENLVRSSLDVEATPIPSTNVSHGWTPEKEKRAREALAQFREVTSRMTAEGLQEEQERVKRAKEKMASMQVSEPKISMITDEFGHKWKRLEYPGGVVRYDFPN